MAALAEEVEEQVLKTEFVSTRAWAWQSCSINHGLQKVDEDRGGQILCAVKTVTLGMMLHCHWQGRMYPLQKGMRVAPQARVVMQNGFWNTNGLWGC